MERYLADSNLVEDSPLRAFKAGDAVGKASFVPGPRFPPQWLRCDLEIRRALDPEFGK
jgi:hypothetical protein